MVQIADLYFYEGKEYTIKELYEKFCRKDIHFETFKSRLKRGWDVDFSLVFKAKNMDRSQKRSYWTISSLYCYKNKGDCANCTVMPEDMKEDCKAKYLIPKILQLYGEPSYDNLTYSIGVETDLNSISLFWGIKDLLKLPQEKRQELIDYWQSPERELERVKQLEPPNELYKVLLCYLNTKTAKEASKELGVSYPVIWNVKNGKKMKQKSVIAKVNKFLKKNGYYEKYKEKE